MTQYDNRNRGSLWPNKKKEKETHADFTGTINVEGREFWFNAWRRKPDASPNSPSLTCTISPKEDRIEPPSSSRSMKDEMDDEIPF
jgi:hypothetical protein